MSIMSIIDPKFQIGYDDVLGARPFHEEYDLWVENAQKDYELGRCFALEYGDAFGIRNMKPTRNFGRFSDAICDTYFSANNKF